MNTQAIPAVENFHILIIKVLPATNKKPARVKIISERFEQSVIIPFTNHPGASNPATDTALLYLQNKGYDTTGKGEGKDHMYIITNVFKPLK